MEETLVLPPIGQGLSSSRSPLRSGAPHPPSSPDFPSGIKRCRRASSSPRRSAYRHDSYARSGFSPLIDERRGDYKGPPSPTRTEIVRVEAPPTRYGTRATCLVYAISAIETLNAEGMTRVEMDALGVDGFDVYFTIPVTLETVRAVLRAHAIDDGTMLSTLCNAAVYNGSVCYDDEGCEGSDDDDGEDEVGGEDEESEESEEGWEDKVGGKTSGGSD